MAQKFGFLVLLVSQMAAPPNKSVTQLASPPNKFVTQMVAPPNKSIKWCHYHDNKSFKGGDAIWAALLFCGATI